MPRQISNAGLAKLKQWEGCVLYAYDDRDTSRPRRFIQPGMPTTGTLTIGYGHTKTVRPGQRISEAEAERLLREDLRPAEQAVEACMQVPLTDGQHAALVSFAYNLGTSTRPGSPLASIAQTLNKGDYAGAIARMQLYNKQRVNGRLVLVPGLVNRRAAEAGLWATGEPVASQDVVAEPPAAAPTGLTAASLGSIAGAATPALAAFAGLPWQATVAIAIALAAVAVAIVLARRERTA
jgi:lysozyme